MAKTKFSLKCIDCGKEYNPKEIRYVCPTCDATNTLGLPQKGILKTIYDYALIKQEPLSFELLKKRGFLDLLPIDSLDSLPYLRVGDTPMYRINELDAGAISFNLFIKDDSQNPTFSFKDRASAVVSAYAKENGMDTIVAASTGNAGSSLAGICASQGQKAIIMVPESAPIAKLTQIVMYGASVVPVKGTYDDAFDFSISATKEFGWYNRNTAYNPYTIEGKKTVAFEILEQMGGKVPQRIFVPVGDGVIISGVYKGFEDLLNLSLIDRMPIIVAVQSAGSPNLVNNIPYAEFKITPSSTIADSISVDVPRNFNMAKGFIEQYKGEVLLVSDKEILQASAILARNTGIFAEPAAATAFAGMLSYQKNKMIEDDTRNVVLLTGSGLKDLKGVAELVELPNAIEPNIANLKKLINKTSQQT